MGRKSKYQIKFESALKEFEEFCDILSKIEYCFAGRFANIMFKHFRSDCCFNIWVNKLDIDILRQSVIENGLNINDKEIYGEQILIKYELCDGKKLNERSKILIDFENKSIDLYFYSFNQHKEYMLNSDNFFNKEDIEMIESESPRVNCRYMNYSDLIYNYLSFLVGVDSEKVHNHLNGSISCMLCGV